MFALLVISAIAEIHCKQPKKALWILLHLIVFLASQFTFLLNDSDPNFF